MIKSLNKLCECLTRVKHEINEFILDNTNEIRFLINVGIS